MYFVCNFLLRLLQSIPRFAVKFDILFFIEFHPYDNIFCCNINIYIYPSFIVLLFISWQYVSFFFFFGFFDDSSKLFIIYLTVWTVFVLLLLLLLYLGIFYSIQRREKKKKKVYIHYLEIKILPRMINGTGLLYIFHRRGFVERYRYLDFIYDRKVWCILNPTILRINLLVYRSISAISMRAFSGHKPIYYLEVRWTWEK